MKHVNMEIIIHHKKKKDIFVQIFGILKNSTSQINAILESERLHIQGMDKSHICLFDVVLDKSWFDSYIVDNTNQKNELSFDSSIFYSILNTKSDDQQLIIKQKEETLEIEFLNKPDTTKNEYNKTFHIPILEYDYEELDVPEMEYDVEFSLPSKKIIEALSQLGNFGESIHIICCENTIELETNSDCGKMCVSIKSEDANSYAIVENEKIDLTFSLGHLNRLCMTSKLTDEIEMNLSDNSPMKIYYSLGENSHLTFHIAPKISDF